MRYRSPTSILPWRVVPPASHKVSRVSWYSGYRPSGSAFRLQGSYLLWPTFPGSSARPDQNFVGPQPRKSKLSRFGLFPVRSPLLRESRFDYFSSGYLDVSVPRVPPPFGVTVHYHRRVPPFGYPWINACLRLPMAFRSLLRPSSAVGA